MKSDKTGGSGHEDCRQDTSSLALLFSLRAAGSFPSLHDPGKNYLGSALLECGGLHRFGFGAACCPFCADNGFDGMTAASRLRKSGGEPPHSIMETRTT